MCSQAEIHVSLYLKKYIPIWPIPSKIFDIFTNIFVQEYVNNNPSSEILQCHFIARRIHNQNGTTCDISMNYPALASLLINAKLCHMCIFRHNICKESM